MIVRTIFVLALSLFAQAVVAQTICWIERVIKSDSGVKVVLIERHRNALAAIKYKDQTRPVQSFMGNLAFFNLQEGDVGYLFGGAHDGCTVTALRQDGRLGILLEASFTPPLPPGLSTSNEVRTVNAFMPAEDY